MAALACERWLSRSARLRFFLLPLGLAAWLAHAAAVSAHPPSTVAGLPQTAAPRNTPPVDASSRSRRVPSAVIPGGLAQHFADTADTEMAPPPSARLAYFQGSLAQNGGEESLDSLNRRVTELERTRGAEPAEYRIRGFTHNIFGLLQGDTVSVGQSAANIAQVGHAPNGTDLRRARLGVQGLGYDYYFYRFEADFAQPDKVTGRRPRLVDAYAEIRELPFGTLRMGQFRVPLSIDRLTAPNDLTFIERGLPQVFNPGRELGIMAMNSTPNYVFSWYSDLSTQGANNEGEQFGKAGRVDLTQRVVFLPWYDNAFDGRYLFQFGGGYLYSNTRNRSVLFGSAPEAVLQYDDQRNILPNFVSTGGILARDTQIIQAEASTVLGPLSFQAEYYGVFVDPTVNPLAAQSNLFFSGWYVFGSFFLTGEHRLYNRTQAIYTSVTPFTNFFRVRGADRGIITGLGAWEFTVRFSQLNLSDRYIQGGRLNDVTFGLNWYLTQQMKIMANYIYAINDVHNVTTFADVFLTRAQVVW